MVKGSGVKGSSAGPMRTVLRALHGTHSTVPQAGNACTNWEELLPPEVEPATPVAPMRSIAVVGSRLLPHAFKSKVEKIVDDLMQRGFHIASGGAMGTDDVVLSHLIERGQFHRGIIYSPWNTLKGFPVKVRPHIRTFHSQGGNIVWGDSNGAEHPNAVKAALLGRNARLVEGCSGVTAFLTEDSRGTFFTVKTAITKRKKLVLFPIDRNLPCFDVVRWVPLKCGGIWDGAFKAVYLR